ncbi:hypothetical protein [Nonomuraea candida]|uniref:hypothetical protein n=1 Tax=Nonomuraea candida TaxID=359159 RepID=UPI0005B98519|nr:hypothetical protein [Nonomuraea candida]
MALHFVGVDPDNTSDECESVWVDHETGRIFFQGPQVTDPETLAWINSDSRILPGEAVISLGPQMISIIQEAINGTYEPGKRRYAPGEHPRPDEDVRGQREGADLR